MLKASSVPAVELHNSTMTVVDIETHIRRTSYLMRLLFLVTRSDVDLADPGDRAALDTLVDEIASHASAAEHLFDTPNGLNTGDMEEHVRASSNLARMLFQVTRSPVDFSDARDRDGLRTQADKILDHASAAEQILDARLVA